MRKHLHQLSSSLLITMLLCLLATGLCAQDSDETTLKTWEELAKEPDGWTTSSKEISITSAEELAWVAKMVNEATDTGATGEKGFEGVTITLTTDLDLAGHLWMSIGNDNYNNELIKEFKGTFDGGDHTINNMTINTDYAAGLFGHIKNATIKNVKLANCSITKTKVSPVRNYYNIYLGCIAANSTTSTIQSCQVIKGSIIRENSQGESIGGIIGVSTGSTITDCEFEGSITVSQSENGRGEGQISSGNIGGIVGDHGNSRSDAKIGSITNCHATLTMNIEGGDAGGITSYNRGVIKECTAKGKIYLTTGMLLYRPPTSVKLLPLLQCPIYRN